MLTVPNFAQYNEIVKITLRHILISDDVRTENNGKLLLIGLYSREMDTQRLPLIIPLAFTVGVLIEGDGAFALTGKLTRPASGEELLTFEATGKTRKSGAGYVPFKFPSVTFKDAGIYEVSVCVKGQEERLAETFEVKAA